MTTYNTYKMSKVIEQKMKADLIELGHSPSSSYFDMDREEIDDFISIYWMFSTELFKTLIVSSSSTSPALSGMSGTSTGPLTIIFYFTSIFEV